MGLAIRNGCLVVLAAVLSWSAAEAARTTAPATVRDLVYGEILFEFYQDRYFAAITRQLVAEHRGELTFHADESELLAGGMYLAYGQQNRAEQIFNRLLQKRASVAVQQQARLQLARSHYRRGSFTATAALIADQQWDEDIKDDATALLARSLLALGRFQEAEQLLQGLKQTSEAAFAHYNLGVALAGQGKFDAAARQLRIVADTPARSRRGLFRWRRQVDVDTAVPALRDKARLALGYTQIQNDLAEDALQTLADVDLDGPFASASLLGAGWAAARLQRYDVALAAWRVLQTRDAADPAVQEAWFAVPYALGELSAHDQAAVAFEHSIAAMLDEDRSLRAAIDTLNQEGLASTLLADDEAVDWDAGWRLLQAPDHALSRYLYLLIADNVFQQHLRDYRDLQTLSGLLNRKQADLASYRNMLAARQIRFAQRAPLAQGVVDGSRLEHLRKQAMAIRSEIDKLTGDGNYLRLATTDEQDQLKRLQTAAERISRLPADQAETLSDRLRVLQGLLRWRLSAEYAARLHDLERGLAAVEVNIVEAESRKQRLATALQLAPESHEQFALRLDDMTPRIAMTQRRIAQTLQQTDARLVELATGELQQRRQRLAQYLDQARYALAAIYDRAAAEGS